MSKILDYLAEPETAVVFDIDGVLAVYEFGDLVHSACRDDEWESYMRSHNPYQDVPPVSQIQDFVAHKDPDRVFACSVGADYEEEGKRSFVLANYAIPQDNIRIVRDKKDKLKFLEDVADKLDLPQERVAIVEDTVKTLDKIYDKTDFTTVHISSFFAYEPPELEL